MLRDKIAEIIDLYNDHDKCPVDGSKVSWQEYRDHFAQAITEYVEKEYVTKKEYDDFKRKMSTGMSCEDKD